MKHQLGSGYSVAALIGREGFRSLEKCVWDRLAQNNGSYFPFLCHDWYALWLSHFPDTDIHIPVLYSGDEIVAIMPMMRRVVRRKGLEFRVFEFIGNAYAQARAMLCDTTDHKTRTMYAGLMFRYFIKYAPPWDYLDLHGLQTENGSFLQLVEAAERSSLSYTTGHDYVNCHQSDISVSADEYLSQRPAIVGKNARYYQRRMEKDGKVEFRLVENDPDMDTVMDSYYELYAKSWKKSESLSPTFHRDLAKLAAANGWLRLGFFCLNGVPVACQMWFHSGSTAYWVKTCYDESFKRYSPGTVLTARMVRTLINDFGITNIDMLQGNQSYKKDWVDGERDRNGLRIFSRSFRGMALSLFFRQVRPFLERYLK